MSRVTEGGRVGRWRQGESLSHIGRVLDKHPASVFGVLKLFGGIPPSTRCRTPTGLSLCEREEKSRGITARASIRAIAYLLGRAPSTSIHASHETIYRSLYIQFRGVLKQELQNHLRTGRVFRQFRSGNKSGMQSQSIKDGVPISERPLEVEDRAIPGHWEGDLISGSANTHIATLVERQSRFTMLVKVAVKDTQTVVDALTQQMRELPEILKQSLTWDRGSELAVHPTNSHRTTNFRFGSFAAI